MVYGSKDFSTDSGRGGRVSLNPSKARFAHTAVLKVTGLGMSAPDRNLATILTFLERKASKNQSKQITINKVCFNTHDETHLCVVYRSLNLHSRHQSRRCNARPSAPWHRCPQGYTTLLT